MSAAQQEQAAHAPRIRSWDLPEKVLIREVGPRDGLQSLGRTISTADKIRMVDTLTAAGFRSIEFTGFAHPRVIPELADAEDVAAGIERRPGVDYRALVPSLRGAERAVAARVDTLVALLTASESYSRRNQNRSVAELVAEVGRVLELGRQEGVPVDVALGIAFFCPYEGRIREAHIEDLVAQLVETHGATDVYVATTVGMADPRHVFGLCSRLLDRWPDLGLGFHLHNTNGMALANAIAAAQAGVTTFEGSICGIGGGIAMPHGMGTVGNVPTEDLVHLFALSGVDTDLDPDAVLQAGRDIARIIGVESQSFMARGGSREQVAMAAAAAIAGTDGKDGSS